MKKIIIFISASICLLLCITACERYNTWPDGLPEMENVYYIGFYKSNVNTDSLNYEIATDGSARWRINATTWNNTDEINITSPIPLEFHSEKIRSYDVVTYFWIANSPYVSTKLTAGTDYSVMTENGVEITPDAQGVYSVTWQQAKKGIQNVKIKRLTSAQGWVKVYVLNPALGAPNASDLSTTVNNHTNDYEVRGFTFDYSKVNIWFN